MEARRLYTPDLGLVPDDHTHSPLCAVHNRCANRKSHHVVSQIYETIRMVGDIGIRQYHQVKAANLYRPDGMYEPRSTAFADVEVPEG